MRPYPMLKISEIEGLRDELPLEFNERIVKAFQSSLSPSEQLKGLLQLVEHLCMYFAKLLNAEYLTRDEADPELERKLRAISTPLSFGNYIDGVRKLEQALEPPYRISELQKVFSDELPRQNFHFVVRMEFGREGRDKYGIPVSNIDAWIDDQVGKGFNRKVTLQKLFDEVVQVRNASAHPEKKAWWDETNEWFNWVNSLFAPAVKSLLEWEPLRNILSNYRRVEALDQGKKTLDGWEVTYREIGAPSWSGPLQSPIAVLPHPPTNRSFFVDIRSDVASYVFKDVEFRTLRISQRQQEEEYRQKFLEHYLRVGMVDRVARDELDEEKERLDLSNDVVKKLERDLQEQLVKSARQIDQDTSDDVSDCLEDIRRALGDQKADLFPELEENIRELESKRRTAVFQLVDDATIISFRKLQNLTQLNPELLEETLDVLCTHDEVVKLAGSGDENFYSAALVEPVRQFLTMLTEIEREDLSIDEVDQRELVQLCYDLLPERTAALEARFQKIFESSQESDVEIESDDTEAELRLVLEGETIEADTVEALFVAIYHEVGNSTEFVEAVPYPKDQEQYLISSRAEHANGDEFETPIQVGDFYFEGNRDRWKALIESECFLKDAGLNASVPDFIIARDQPEMPQAVEDDELLERPDKRNALGIQLEVDGKQYRISGTTVASYFTNLLGFLIAEDLLSQDVLPFLAGRVRYLVATEPLHSNGKFFRTVVHNQITTGEGEPKGVYMEAAFTRDDALANTKGLCEELGVEVTGSFDAKDRLAIEIEDKSIAGDTVRDFVKKIAAHVDGLGYDLSMHAPLQATSKRHFMNVEPRHVDGAPFTAPEEYGGVYFEVNLAYEQAREFIQKLLKELGVAFQFDTQD